MGYANDYCINMSSGPQDTSLRMLQEAARPGKGGAILIRVRKTRLQKTGNSKRGGVMLMNLVHQDPATNSVQAVCLWEELC